jgi:hypothetical protein
MASVALAEKQFANALVIYRTAIPYGRDAALGALMTAIAESSLLVYANDGSTKRVDVPQKWRDVAARSMSFPHDAVAGSAWTTADSVGLYQQRPMFNYGTIAELMDPARSTEIFLTGNTAHTTRAFLNAPKDLSLAQRCQWTQGSEFPTGENYAPNQPLAEFLVSKFGAGADTPVTQGDWFMANNWDEAKAEVDKEFADLREYIVSGNVQNAQAAAILAAPTGSKNDDGSAASLAGVLQTIVGQNQRIEATQARIEARLSALEGK